MRRPAVPQKNAFVVLLHAFQEGTTSAVPKIAFVIFFLLRASAAQGSVDFLRRHVSPMSYNVAICTPPVPEDDSSAWQLLDNLIEAQGPVPTVFKELHDQLTAKYPCICTLSDDNVDDGVWSDGPLWNDFGHRAAVLGIVFSRVNEVLPFLIGSAKALGLTVFDWGGPTIYRPPRAA
jgi:hypothetical protein